MTKKLFLINAHSNNQRNYAETNETPIPRNQFLIFTKLCGQLCKGSYQKELYRDPQILNKLKKASTGTEIIRILKEYYPTIPFGVYAHDLQSNKIPSINFHFKKSHLNSRSQGLFSLPNNYQNVFNYNGEVKIYKNSFNGYVNDNWLGHIKIPMNKRNFLYESNSAYQISLHQILGNMPGIYIINTCRGSAFAQRKEIIYPALNNKTKVQLQSVNKDMCSALKVRITNKRNMSHTNLNTKPSMEKFRNTNIHLREICENDENIKRKLFINNPELQNLKKSFRQQQFEIYNYANNKDRKLLFPNVRQSGFAQLYQSAFAQSLNQSAFAQSQNPFVNYPAFAHPRPQSAYVNPGFAQPAKGYLK